MSLLALTGRENARSLGLSGRGRLAAIALPVDIIQLQRVEARLIDMHAKVAQETADSAAISEAVEALIDVERQVPGLIRFSHKTANDGAAFRAGVQGVREDVVESAATLIAQAETRVERLALIDAQLAAVTAALDERLQGLSPADQRTLARRRAEQTPI